LNIDIIYINMNIPLDVVSIICEYDMVLTCKLHTLLPAKSNINLAKYCTENKQYTHILYDIFKSDWTEDLVEIAVLSNNIDAVRFLLSHPLSESFVEEWLPEHLSYAISHRYDEISYLILERPDINVEWNECRLLDDAVYTESPRMVETILDHPNMVDTCSYLNSAFIQSINMNNPDLIDIFLHHEKIDIHMPYDQPQELAWELENWELADIIARDRMKQSIYVWT